MTWASAEVCNKRPFVRIPDKLSDAICLYWQKLETEFWCQNVLSRICDRLWWPYRLSCFKDMVPTQETVLWFFQNTCRKGSDLAVPGRVAGTQQHPQAAEFHHWCFPLPREESCALEGAQHLPLSCLQSRILAYARHLAEEGASLTAARGAKGFVVFRDDTVWLGRGGFKALCQLLGCRSSCLAVFLHCSQGRTWSFFLTEKIVGSLEWRHCLLIYQQVRKDGKRDRSQKLAWPAVCLCRGVTAFSWAALPGNISFPWRISCLL